MIKCIRHKLRHNIPQEDIEKAYDSLKIYFGETWLNKDSNHPLQSLWRRHDDLAMIELYSFGNSVLTIKDKAPEWVKEKVKRIKSNDVGAIFEILAAAMFEKGENHEVIFPPGDYPIFDLIVQFKDESKMNVSCKNHRKSKNSQRFDVESEKFEKRFVNYCKNLGITNIQCLIFSNKYPEENPDWLRLDSYISDVLIQGVINGISNKLKSYTFDNWTIMISDISEYKKHLSDSFLSYTLLITAPFHNNELKNLQDHLEDKAIHKFSNKPIVQDENNINIIFVNLGDNYSLDVLENWAKEYFKNNKMNIAGIYFQKGYLTHELERFEIVYAYRLVKNDHYDIWNQKNYERLVNVISPMNKYCIHSEMDPKIVVLCEKDGKKESIKINKDRYVYHYGELYLKDYENLSNKIGTPGFRRYLVKKVKNGHEIHYCNTPKQDNFTLL